MSHRCNLSTSAVRDSVSARKPPIQPTPITAASTVFTARSRVLQAHKNHDATVEANVFHHCEPTGPARSGRPDDKLREAIQKSDKNWIASSLSLLAMMRGLAVRKSFRYSGGMDFALGASLRPAMT